MATACCMATAQAKAGGGEGNTTTTPWSRLMTSAPPFEAMAWRRSKRWARRTSSAISPEMGDWLAVVGPMQPTMSVQSTVTLLARAIVTTLLVIGVNGSSRVNGFRRADGRPWWSREVRPRVLGDQASLPLSTRADPART